MQRFYKAIVLAEFIKKHNINRDLNSVIKQVETNIFNGHCIGEAIRVLDVCLYLSKEDLVELYFEQQLRERP
jgi:hypothetical protein